MKVILYMEMTVNGFVAKPDDNTDWISDEAWESYTAVMAEVDAIIIGKRTYDLMPQDEFQKSAEYIVVTSSKPVDKKVPNVVFFNDTPAQIIEQLQKKGHENIAIAGGGKANVLFMNAGLIDEIYLDIEPVVFGSGIPLFAKDDFEYKLEFLDTKMLNKNTIQLHYRVLK